MIKHKKYIKPRKWVTYPTLTCPCVLVYKEIPVPLQKVKYDVAINGGLANVTLSQTYKNKEDTAINVEYNFPVNEEVVFSKIEAIFQNRKVQGQIKEKDQAKKEFIIHKTHGDTVAFAEQLKDTEDIMKVQLGNFPSGEELTICFSYLVRLDVINEVNWAFRIPATLTPRYNPASPTSETSNNQIMAKGFRYKYKAIGAYTWEVNVNICWPGGAKKVISLSHADEVAITNQPGMINVKFDPSKGAQYPNKDFELVIEDNNLFSNVCQVAMSNQETISGQTPKYAAMMQFIPSMYKWYTDKGVNEEQGVDIYADDHNDFLMDHTYAEYVFILDRSGSMGGKRIENAKNSLIFFLKSLPYRSRFNIISFGTKFNSMFPESVEYNKVNLKNAINQIQSFGANMGGTNILGPLNNSFSCKKPEKYQRNIFLLTDGAVGNTNEVFKAIELNCLYGAARVYTIGIGNGCSELLVRKSARLGNGRSVIIGDNESVESKIIPLLKDSLTPSLTHFKVEFDPKYISAISPMPNEQSHITRGQPFIMYALIKNDIESDPNMKTEIKVTFWDSVSEQFEERVFALGLNGCIVNDSYHKMCVKKILENSKRKIKASYLDPKLEEVSDIYTKLAVAYQVLSSDHTAFICVIKENKDGKFVQTKDVILSTMESIDYLGNGPQILTHGRPQMMMMRKGGGPGGALYKSRRQTEKNVVKKLSKGPITKLNKSPPRMPPVRPTSPKPMEMNFRHKNGKGKAKQKHHHPELEPLTEYASENQEMLDHAKAPKKPPVNPTKPGINLTFMNPHHQKESKPKKDLEPLTEYASENVKINENVKSPKLPRVRPTSPKPMELNFMHPHRHPIQIEEKIEVLSESDDEYDDDESDTADPTHQGVKANTQLIVSHQKIKGCWEFSESILIQINAKDIFHLKEKIPDQRALMTIILVAWLQKFADKDAVGMIINKATGYLRRTKIDGYKALIEEAKNLF